MKEKLNKRSKEIAKEISSIDKRISGLPEGTLRCHKAGNSYKFYQFTSDGRTHNGQRKYINKKHIATAQKLATKEYLILRKRELLREMKAIDAYQKIVEKGRPSSEYWTQNSGISSLMSGEFRPVSAQLNEWQNEAFESSAQNQEARIIKAPCGLVRSKSELLIAMELTRKKIPYRYECDLEIGGITFHPDFTVRHPKTGEMFIWEHFGLMDNKQYASRAFSKLQSYYGAGWIPSVNLIATYETAEKPLDVEYVDTLIKYYLGG